ncbi:MAG: hypothetical protein Q9195_003495 [Heterodermia aff. obscurata]
MPVVRFLQYLPSSGRMITSQVGDKCAAEVANYQANHLASGTQRTRDLCRAALNCILDNLDSTTAYNLQAANVLLGLTPTMLSLLGNAPAEIALLAFSGRPLLAFLLNAGAPVIAVTSTFKHQYPLEVLQDPDHNSKSPFPTFDSQYKSILVATAEYLLAAAAAINVALLASDISTKAVYVPNCGRTWYAFLWMYLCLPLHGLGLTVFWARVRVKHPPYPSLTYWTKHEPKSCASHSGTAFSLKEESYAALFLEWMLSHGAILQIIFGTLVLSSSTLIDTSDAFALVGRWAASAIVCRLVLMYELYGLRAAVGAGRVSVG